MSIAIIDGKEFDVSSKTGKNECLEYCVSRNMLDYADLLYSCGAKIKRPSSFLFDDLLDNPERLTLHLKYGLHPSDEVCPCGPEEWCWDSDHCFVVYRVRCDCTGKSLMMTAIEDYNYTAIRIMFEFSQYIIEEEAPMCDEKYQQIEYYFWKLRRTQIENMVLLVSRLFQQRRPGLEVLLGIASGLPYVDFIEENNMPIGDLDNCLDPRFRMDLGVDQLVYLGSRTYMDGTEIPMPS